MPPHCPHLGEVGPPEADVVAAADEVVFTLVANVVPGLEVVAGWLVVVGGGGGGEPLLFIVS